MSLFREAADEDDVKSKLCSSSCFWEVLEANPE
jgi:hypothetical protein